MCEQHAVTFSAGLALQGMKPVVAIYSTFLQRAYDQIIHDVCLTNVPVAFALDRSGLVGDDTHGHVDDVARFAAPGTVVCAVAEDPADPADIAPNP